MSDPTSLEPAPSFLRWPLTALVITVACAAVLAIFADQWWAFLVVVAIGVIPSLVFIYLGLKWKRQAQRFRLALKLRKGEEDDDA